MMLNQYSKRSRDVSLQDKDSEQDSNRAEVMREVGLIGGKTKHATGSAGASMQ